MRYVVDVTQNQLDEISRLIKEGRYKNFQQFILAAIDNQIYIEKDDIKNEIGGSASQATLVRTIEKHYDDRGRGLVTDVEIESRIGLKDIKSSPKTIGLPKYNDLACSGTEKPIDEEYGWLWGQVNRIFPVKLGLRVLMSMLGNEELIELEPFSNKASDVALAYGKMIRNHERRNGKLRDERVSAGLPVDKSIDNPYAINLQRTRKIEELESYLTNEEFKSKHRYKSHFLAYVRRDLKLEGAMPYLRVVNLENNNGKTYIGLTNQGLKFASLENPIIDNNDLTKSLSEKESNFYLEHISQNVIGEKSAIKWLLEKLEKGFAEREKINAELKNNFDNIWDNPSDAVINTQRAGLMARMFELGLIEKEKKGISVRYKVSAQGSDFLKKLKGGY